jgi:16S rRNA processing protein RimM
MIKKDNCLLLGTLAKPHGTRGSLLLWLKNLKAEDINKRESVFVEIDGLLVPFFIENFLRNSEESAILKFEEIDSETKAKSLTGLYVYVLINDKVKRKKRYDKTSPSISGYKVTDIRMGFVGIAGEIAEIANNPLLQVMHEGKEFLVPVHEDIILEVNDMKKEIRIDAPEGLFDL